jgi:hypothetical protein
MRAVLFFIMSFRAITAKPQEHCQINGIEVDSGR